MDETLATASAANSKYEMKARRADHRRADSKKAGASDRAPRKRGAASEARFARIAPPQSSRPISVKEGHRYHYTPSAPPRAMAVLTRTLGRRIYPRKFGKAGGWGGWGRARSLAAVAFVALAALFIASRGPRRHRRLTQAPGAGLKVEDLGRNLTGRDGGEGGGTVVQGPMPQNFSDADVAHAQGDTESGDSSPREALDEAAPGASHSSLSFSQDSPALDGPQPSEKLQSESAPEGDASKTSGATTEWSFDSEKSDEGLGLKHEGVPNFEAPQTDFAAPQTVDRLIKKVEGARKKSHSFEQKEANRPRQIEQTDGAKFPTERSLRESLRKEMNWELENAGEKRIPPTPNTASDKSSAEEQHSTAEAKKKYASKFEDLILHQSSKWDNSLLTGENPWRDLSGAHGSYGPASETSLVIPSVEIWSHKDISPSKNAKYPYCRLFNACRSKSGQILLQKGLEKHRKMLRKCGIRSDNNFVLGTAATEAGINFVQSTTGARTREMDLVDRHPLRRGATHFFADSLKTLFFFDAVYGSANPASGIIEKICLDDSGDRNGSCSAERATDVRPVLFVRKESFVDDLWVPQYMRLLSSNGTVNNNTPLRYLNIYDIYPKTQPGESDPVQCFRSITTSASMYGQLPASAFTSANPFFSGNNIDRNPAPVSASDEEDSQCHVRLKLSDHLEVDSESKKGIQRMVQILKVKTGLGVDAGAQSKIAFKLVLPATERAPFSKQVEHMQEADILVTPYGLPMVDLIFLRSGASVIEVHPFSFVSGMFHGISTQLGLSYHTISAEPDVQMFEDCLTKFSGSDGALDMSALVHKMKLAAGAHLANDGNSTMHLDEGGPEYYEIHEIKQCAKKQRLRVSYERVAEEAWRAAIQICYKRKAGAH